MLTRILSCALACTALITAQDTRGMLLGRVTDSSGAAVPNVEVRVTNEATGTTASGRSNETGSYVVPYLLPGTYRIEAGLNGFKTFSRTGIQVRDRKSTRL